MNLYTVSFFKPERSQSRKRKQISDEFKWDLTDIYASDKEWEKEKEKWSSRIKEIATFKGKLSSSAEFLLNCVEFQSHMQKEFSRLYSYAHMKSDEDIRKSEYIEKKQELEQLYTEYATEFSFFEPEIAAFDKGLIERFIQEKDELKKYAFILRDIIRRREHMLSENEEKILARAHMIAEGPYAVFSIFSNAEFDYPEVTLSDGSNVKLDQSGFSKYRALPNHHDREKVFKAFFRSLEKFKGTFGVQLYTQIKKDIFYAQSRGYESSLHRAVDPDNIPVSVYHTLIDNVNNNLRYFHRYLKLKRKMLNVDTLKYSDLYAPVVKDIELKYRISRAWDLILDAVNVLGKEYVQVVEQARKNRWIDVYPSTGKRSGAYSNGNVYDVHPYILLNYNDQYSDVSTLAHELGHTMHSYFSNQTQPFATADYSIFVAEVASTLNEILLKEKMIHTIGDKDVRLSLLMEYLDSIKGTVFRQTQFAEFELNIHEEVEKGNSLSGESLTRMYESLLKKYYGHEEDICLIEKPIPVEWAYVPHFYYNFYVYQYATSFTASTALAEKIINKEEGSLERYLDFLKAGGSDYPINLLKKAGVDMTSSEPFKLTMEAMNRTMDEIEGLVG
ncbi:MAG: oligoendopeptidase F [bacterium]